MNGLYYQYGAGPASMQTPDYQTFLRLLEEMRKQNGGSPADGNSLGGGQQNGQGGGMGGLASLFKMFGGMGNAGPSASAMAGAAGGVFDTPGAMGMGGISGLIA